MLSGKFFSNVLIIWTKWEFGVEELDDWVLLVVFRSYKWYPTE